MKENPILFESAEVSKVVGMSPIQLNRLVEREQYGIGPSIRSGKGRGSRRLFSEADLYGVALVWWLFEAGLRSQTIQYVLNQICRRRDASANDAAARILQRGGNTMLIIRREPRKDSVKEDHPKQEVVLDDWTAANHFVESTVTASVLFIPVADRFEKLKADSWTLGPSVDEPDRSK